MHPLETPHPIGFWVLLPDRMQSEGESERASAQERARARERQGVRRGQKKRRGRGGKTPMERKGEKGEREGERENEYGLNLFNYLH